MTKEEQESHLQEVTPAVNSGEAHASKTQRTSAIPPMPKNRFGCLDIEEANEDILDKPSTQGTHCPMETLRRPYRKLPNWERRLPKEFTVAATPSAHSFDLKVEIQTTDTEEVKSLTTLLDCGASGLFIDTDYVKEQQLNTRKLSCPIPVNNVKGTPNEAGPIEEIVDVILRYETHMERTKFAVTRLGGQQMLLGLPWLREHNPEIDWSSGEVKMSHCPARCRTCKDEVKAETKACRAEIHHIWTCHAGPFPEPEIDWEGIPELVPDPDDDEEEEEIKSEEALEERDRICVTQLLPEPEEILASSNFSQRMAEAHRKNTAPKTSSLPNHFCDFEDVFSEKSFEALPQPKEWDHYRTGT
jgi:hypothetical protein